MLRPDHLLGKTARAGAGPEIQAHREGRDG